MNQRESLYPFTIRITRCGLVGQRLATAIVISATILLGACGSDDDSTSDTVPATAGASVTSADAAKSESTSDTTATGSAPTSDTTASSSAPTSDTTASSSESQFGEVCALAHELNDQQDVASPEQLEKYKALAPDEIAEPVDFAAGELIAAGDDTVALFNSLGRDEVEAAIAEINAWEEEHCGIPHSEINALPAGTTQEIETNAARVGVTATDFAFDAGPVAPGRTSFVLTNDGAEAHFLLIFKLGDGVTLEQAMADDAPEGSIVGEWSTAIASAGDDETVTFDVEPGTYAMVCFLPTVDGTPHTMLGMQTEFTVA